MPISILLLSDVRLYREAIAAAVTRSESIVVAGIASNVAEAEAMAGSLAPAVIVVDVAMLDSLRAIQRLAAQSPPRKIVAFAVNERASDIVAYVEAGIAGYASADASTDDLLRTIEGVVQEEVQCSPKVAAALFKRLAAHAAHTRLPGPPMLSQREREVLALVRTGLCNKEIAQRLTIEVATVKNHIHNVLTKLQVTSRAEAATRAADVVLRSRTVSS